MKRFSVQTLGYGGYTMEERDHGHWVQWFDLMQKAEEAAAIANQSIEKARKLTNYSSSRFLLLLHALEHAAIAKALDPERDSHLQDTIRDMIQKCVEAQIDLEKIDG